MADQIRPNFGAAPKGRAKIKLQGQTQVKAWGADPYATGEIPETTDLPDL